jgi:hypothetical protein
MEINVTAGKCTLWQDSPWPWPRRYLCQPFGTESATAAGLTLMAWSPGMAEFARHSRFTHSAGQNEQDGLVPF